MPRAAPARSASSSWDETKHGAMLCPGWGISIIPAELKGSSLRRSLESALYTLIGVENFRPAMFGHRFLNRLDAEVRFHADRQTPRQNPPTEPIHHRHQVDKSPSHRNIGDVGTPHLVRPVDDQPPQQVRIHGVIRMASAGVR